MIRLGVLLVCFMCPGVQATESRLYDQLLTGYNRFVRPVTNPSTAIRVDLEFELKKIVSVDEKHETLTVVGFFAAQWHDELLTWTPSAYAGIEQIVLPPDKIWLPDIGMENSADSFYHDHFRKYFRVLLRYDGAVLWEFGGMLSTTCGLDMTYYPFDRQMCSVDIENWAYSGHEVDLRFVVDHVDLDGYEVNGLWTLERTNVSRVDQYFAVTGDVAYPEVVFQLYLLRKTQYYLLNLLLPCIFVIVVALGTFWLPAESGEKASVGITVLLAFSVFQLVISEKTPENSDHLPILGRFVAIIMALSTLSVLTSIFVLYMYHKNSAYAVPQTLHRLVFRGIASLVCMRGAVPTQEHRAPPAASLDPRQHTNSPKDSMTQLVMELEAEAKKPKALGAGSDEMSEILRMLTMMTDRMKEKDRQTATLDEWKALARVLDRLLFWICFVAVVVVTIVFMTMTDPEH